MSEVSKQKTRRARREARAAMENASQSKQTITYTQLVGQIEILTFTPNGRALSDLLCQISREDDSAGRGMLSGVVVHAAGDEMPGEGFFEVAAELGRNVEDQRAFWEAELSPVYANAKAAAS
jgi:hypothetical protein